MTIHFELPSELEAHLRSHFENVEVAAKEAMGVELFRLGTLTHAQLSTLLNLSRYETDGVLKRHGAYYDMSIDDVIRDTQSSERTRGR